MATRISRENEAVLDKTSSSFDNGELGLLQFGNETQAAVSAVCCASCLGADLCP